MALITLGDGIAWLATRKLRTLLVAAVVLVGLRMILAFVQEFRAVPTFGTQD